MIKTIDIPTTLAQLPDGVFDARAVPCSIKHGRIFDFWNQLAVGAHFDLVNDHDPVPLYYQFAAQFPGAFTWEYQDTEAEAFCIRITRLAETTPYAPPARRGGCNHHGPAQSVQPVRVLDARGLEPPEPMARILAAVAALPAGEVLLAQTDRDPIHLKPMLEAQGLEHASEELADGSWRSQITRR